MPKMENNVEVFTPLGCYFMMLPRSLTAALVLSLPCLILISFYQLPYLEHKPSFNVKNIRNLSPFFQSFTKMTPWSVGVHLESQLSVFMSHP